jgi:hypothetical protein
MVECLSPNQDGRAVFRDWQAHHEETLQVVRLVLGAPSRPTKAMCYV